MSKYHWELIGTGLPDCPPGTVATDKERDEEVYFFPVKNKESAVWPGYWVSLNRMERNPAIFRKVEEPEQRIIGLTAAGDIPKGAQCYATSTEVHKEPDEKQKFGFKSRKCILGSAGRDIERDDIVGIANDGKIYPFSDNLIEPDPKEEWPDPMDVNVCEEIYPNCSHRFGISLRFTSEKKMNKTLDTIRAMLHAKRGEK